MKATKDLVLYAIFIKDSVYNHVLSSNFFDITKVNGYTDEQDSAFSVTGACAQITLKPQMKSQLRGKITIPVQVPDPQNNNIMLNVISVGGFGKKNPA
jgi:hypothetical protein